MYATDGKSKNRPGDQEPRCVETVGHEANHREMFDRAPPVDVDTERAVIACLVLSAGFRPEDMAAILGGLTEADFGREANRVVFASMKKASEKRVGLKGRFLLGWLKRDGVLKAVGFEELAEIVTAFWLRGHLDYYIRRLREVARERAAIEGAWELVVLAYEGDTRKWIEKANAVIGEVGR